MLSKSLLAAAGGAETAWNLSSAQYLGTPINYYSAGAVLDFPQRGLYFYPDGTRMYTIQNDSVLFNDKIAEYHLSTPWDVGTATFIKQSPNLYSVDSDTVSLWFKPDGTKVYILGLGAIKVFSLTLSTPWDISTIDTINAQSSPVLSGQTSTQVALSFSPDGLNLYAIGSTGTTYARIYRYNLSTAWDITAFTFGAIFDVTAQERQPTAFAFNSTGTSFYVVGNWNRTIFQYSLTTPWLGGITYTGNSVNINPLTNTGPRGLFFNPDDDIIYVTTPYVVAQYTLPTPSEIAGAYLQYPTTKYLNVRTEESSPQNVEFKPDGLQMYMLGFNTVYEYAIPPERPWEVYSPIATPSEYYFGAQEGFASGIFFKPDGRRMYIIGTSGDAVQEYFISTPWSISTASWIGSLSVTINPYGLFFSPDGTKMYYGNSFGEVLEYTLSVAWNISTAVYVQLKSLSSETRICQSIRFKPDGTKMFVLGYLSATVYQKSVFEYILSTPWDISTATYTGRTLMVALQDSVSNGFNFKPDGTMLFLAGGSNSGIYTYDFV